MHWSPSVGGVAIRRLLPVRRTHLPADPRGVPYRYAALLYTAQCKTASLPKDTELARETSLGATLWGFSAYFRWNTRETLAPVAAERVRTGACP